MTPLERKSATTGSVSQSFVFDWFFDVGLLGSLEMVLGFGWFLQVKTGMTMTEKILARASERTHLTPGDNVWVNI